ncbi:DUF2357 domain-containing protein [Methanobacterium formicicum]|uniref:DUF2357 domain-containing protein n=1 Tax=Methanobacterium formicicum TaxID=2162 RepID=UPI00241264BC|nr:DUF2357 domain-containing protein [Methanobacterium formicicum]MDG3547273.1 DUF2357 domain-containing protein [Methanobacterium formicicum]
MVYQSVYIDIYDGLGDKFWGKLKIKAKNNVEGNSNYFEENGISYKNVEKVTELDDETPIQFFKNHTEENISQLVLLEETTYKLVFEPNSSGTPEDIVILPFLINQNDFFLDPWDEEDGPYRAYFNFRSYVGKSFFDVQISGLKSKKYPFEVRSKKIGYYQQYDAMISDLAEVASGMIFEQNAPLLQQFDFGYNKRETAYEEFMFLDYLFRPENLPFAYEFILRNPHSQLEKYSETVPIAFAHEIGPTELVQIVSKPEELFKSDKIPPNWPKKMKSHIPETINHNYYEDTFNTPENRLLKYFLESVDKLIFDILSRVKEGNIRDKILEYRRIIQNYLSDRWLLDVGNLDYIPMNSQVMQKKEGYRDIFKYFIYFEFAFRLKWKDIEDKLEGYEKKLSELYEDWCYIKLLKIVSDLSGKKLKFEDVYQIKYDEWSISLNKGINKGQKFRWTYNNHPIEAKVIFEGRFKKQSYSLPLKPDYTLQIKYKNKNCLLHFDAKYKFQKKFLQYCKALKESDSEEIEIESDDFIYRHYKTDDICKMHTYKDAIADSLGAFVLYPGDVSQMFEECRSVVPSVGAFHLTPGLTDEKEEKAIEKFIEDVLDYISLNKNSV